MLNKQFFKQIGKKILSSLWIVGSLLAGFLIGHYSYILQSKDSEGAKNPYVGIKGPNQVSVAINDANQVMIVDRTTGSYQIYSDSIGTMIFKIYATKVFESTHQK